MPGCRPRPTSRSTISPCAISEQRILLFEASVAAFARSLQIVQNQLDAGIVSRVDLAQAQTQLEQTRAQLVAENINRAQFEHAVAVWPAIAVGFHHRAGRRRRTDVPTFDAGCRPALLERRSTSPPPNG